MLVPKRGPAKRRWQQELDNDDSGEEEVTAEEFDQWRKREDKEPEERDRAVVASNSAVMNKKKGGDEEPAEKRRKKAFAWMDSDEEDNGDADEGEAEDEVAKTHAPSLLAPPLGGGAAASPEQASGGGGFSRSVSPSSSPASAFGAGGLVPPPPPPPARPPAQAQQFWPRPAMVSAVHQGLDDEIFVGRIKRYTDLPSGGGYGFIDCEDIKLRFSRDVYIHKNQMQGLSIGDSVSFTIVRNSKGEPQARNVMRSEDAQLLRHVAQQQQQQQQVARSPSSGGADGFAEKTSGVPAIALQVARSPSSGGADGLVEKGGVFAIAMQACAASSAGAPAAASNGSLMDERQAREFQAALRGSGH